jgi:uncharacterized protein (UPF0335 family)
LEDVRQHCKKEGVLKKNVLPQKMRVKKLEKEEIEEEISVIEGYYDNLNCIRCNYRVVHIR